MPAAAISEVQTQLSMLSPFGVELRPLDRTSGHSYQTPYGEAVRQLQQLVSRAREAQKAVAQMSSETEIERRRSACFARVAAAMSDLFYILSEESANNPRSKMLTDALEELGVIYEDLAESHALASSVHFARRVEEELADLASNNA